MDFDTLFTDICSELSGNGKGNISETSYRFSTCTNDLQRVIFVLDLEAVKSRLTQLADTSVGPSSGKSPDLANSFRIEGNSFYQRRHNHLALKAYNKSVLVGEGEQLALAYANRSAVFHDLSDWLHCLRDIALALATESYPAHLEHKLYERQGNCWLALRDKCRAHDSFSRAKNAASLPPAKHADIVRKLESLDVHVNVSLPSCSTASIESIEQDIRGNRPKTPALPGADLRNAQLPSAVASVHMVTSTERGRCLIATEDLEPGTTVIAEKAFAAVLLDEFKESHCHHCLYSTPGPVPCHRCSQVGYCSTICRDQAWASYHPAECGLTDRLHRSGVGKNGLLAFRTLLKVDRKTLLDVADATRDKTDVYDSADYATIHALVGNTQQRSISDLFRRAVMAVYLAGLMRADNLVAAEFLRLLQSYPCNAHEISQLTVRAGQAVNELSLSEIGSAAMPVLSLINHSCDPNVVRYCYGDVVVVTTVRRVAKGQELLDNYGYHYAIHPGEERRAKLRQQYHFECACQACAENWPLHHHLPGLSAHATLSENIIKDYQTLVQLVYPIQDVGQLEDLSKRFGRHISLLDNDATVRRPVREYSIAQEAFKQCLALLAPCYSVH